MPMTGRFPRAECHVKFPGSMSCCAHVWVWLWMGPRPSSNAARAESALFALGTAGWTRFLSLFFATSRFSLFSFIRHRFMLMCTAGCVTGAVEVLATAEALPSVTQRSIGELSSAGIIIARTLSDLVRGRPNRTRRGNLIIVHLGLRRAPRWEGREPCWGTVLLTRHGSARLSGRVSVSVGGQGRDFLPGHTCRQPPEQNTPRAAARICFVWVPLVLEPVLVLVLVLVLMLGWLAGWLLLGCSQQMQRTGSSGS